MYLTINETTRVKPGGGRVVDDFWCMEQAYMMIMFHARRLYHTIVKEAVYIVWMKFVSTKQFIDGNIPVSKSCFHDKLCKAYSVSIPSKWAVTSIWLPDYNPITQ